MLCALRKMNVRTVEVFKTNISAPIDADMVTTLLHRYFPGSRVSVDLEDCDKVLRIEGSNLAALRVIQLVCSKGYHCSMLD